MAKNIYNGALIIIAAAMAVFPLAQFSRSCDAIGAGIGTFSTTQEYQEQHRVDTAAGVADNLLALARLDELSAQLKGEDVFFFTPYEYFIPYGKRARRMFFYYPHRMRYYLYPAKVWWFTPSSWKTALEWGSLGDDQKNALLYDKEYIVGFNISSSAFPGFAEVMREKRFVVLKKGK